MREGKLRSRKKASVCTLFSCQSSIECRVEWKKFYFAVCFWLRRAFFCCWLDLHNKERKFGGQVPRGRPNNVSPISRPRVGLGRATGHCLGWRFRQQHLLQFSRERRDCQLSRTLVQNVESGVAPDRRSRGGRRSGKRFGANGWNEPGDSRRWCKK